MEEAQIQRIYFLAAEVAMPAMIAFLYSLHGFWRLGCVSEGWPYTYALFFGSILSVAGIFMFADALSKGVRAQPWQFIGSAGAMICYLFALYLFGFLGIYRLYTLLNGYRLLKLLTGLAWIILGYRMLKKVWILSEIAVAKK